MKRPLLTSYSVLTAASVLLGILPFAFGADKSAKSPGTNITPAAPAVNPGAAAARKPVTLGLPRLKTASDADRAVSLAPAKFEIDPLTVPAGATGVRQQAQRHVDFLAIDGRGTWSRALRGSLGDVVFVSFCLNAAIGTQIEIAGALLRVDAHKEAGKAELMIAGRSKSGALQWKPAGLRCSLESYGGRLMASLPLLTVRLDTAAGTWDLYSGKAQVADDLKFADAAKKNERGMSLVAGANGAQLCGLVVSDENPLFPDANANGIDDSFEIERKGAVLAKGSSASAQKVLAKDWREVQRSTPGNVLSAGRTVPDHVIASAPSRKK